MTTLRDVAKRCGMSTMTVSRALAGGNNVLPETRRRVLLAAESMGYTPSAAARSLRTGTTFNVVLANVKQRENPVFGVQSAHAIAEHLSEMGYRLEVKKAASPEALTETLTNLVRAKAADAYILWDVEEHAEESGRLLESLNQPFIARGYYDNHPNWYQVDFNHSGMMAQTLDKLFELGHERIVLISHAHNAPYAVHYRQAYDQIMSRRLGGPVPEDWVITFDETYDSGVKAANRLEHALSQPGSQRPTAIAFGESGSAVRGVDILLLAMGIRVGDAPGQFGVAGISNYPADRMIGGPSWVYNTGNDSVMIAEMIERQLGPLLRREDSGDRIVRYLPSLVRDVPAADIWSVNRGWAVSRKSPPSSD